MKLVKPIICASVLTLALTSPTFAGNIGGMKTTSTGNIGGLRTDRTGNIGGLKTESTGNIGGLRSNPTPAVNGILSDDMVLSVGRFLSILFSIW